MSNLLPIADGPELRLQARLLARRHRRGLVGVVGLHAARARAGVALAQRIARAGRVGSRDRKYLRSAPPGLWAARAMADKGYRALG